MGSSLRLNINGSANNPPIVRLVMSLKRCGAKQHPPATFLVGEEGATVNVFIRSMRCEGPEGQFTFEGTAQSDTIETLKTSRRVIGYYDGTTRTGNITPT